MTPLDCERWRGDLAMAAVDRLEAPERRALATHLAACASCRGELAELESVARALVLADPALVQPGLQSVPSPRPGPSLALAPAPSVHHRPRLRWALGGLGVAAALAAATLLWLGPMSPQAITVSLRGSKGVQATAVLTAEHWGTDLSLLVAGQPAGDIYRVSMESTAGTWWQAGSYRAENGSVHVDLACGVDPRQVDRIWVENSAGRVVLQAYLG